MLGAHPVAPAAVRGVPDEVKGELAKAYLILRAGTEITAEALIGHWRVHLAAHKVPRAIQFTSRVPTMSSGEVVRRLLRDIDDGAR